MKKEEKDYIIIPYKSVDDIFEYLAEFSKTDFEVLKGKNHYQYFSAYFKHEKLKTIIVEKSYIDKDYLDDFAYYYVRSFREYSKSCSRLHFFKKEITSEQFGDILSNGSDQSLLKDSYLGSMIVKPIPNTCIGKTTLKHYAKNEKGRVYPIARPYKANLFGIELSVVSLAFQEQDKSVSACATSALWSVFQGTGMLFHHNIPSPVHITESATKNYPAPERKFPSSGLNPEMMAQAIRDVQLEPYYIDPPDYHHLKANLYAFLEAKIPAILGLALYETKDERIPKGQKVKVTLIGLHAVAVTGYSLANKPSNFFDGKNEFPFYLKSSKMDQIFVHDDQLGPFARMEFDDDNGQYLLPQMAGEVQSEKYSRESDRSAERSERDGSNPQIGAEPLLVQQEAQNQAAIKAAGNSQVLSTTWRSKHGEDIKIVAQPKVVLIPIHNKIRVPFKEIFQVVRNIDFTLFYNILKSTTYEDKKIVWDIKLNWIQDIKTEFLKAQKDQPISNLSEIVSAPFPKYIWRAILEMKGVAMFEIWFDATDISNANNYLRLVPRHEEWINTVFAKTILSKIDVEQILDHHTKTILKQILADFKSKKEVFGK